MTDGSDVADARRFVVAHVDDLPPGTRRLTTIGGRSIGVFNVDGRFYALRNSCPHQGAQLCTGEVLGTLTAPRPGEFVYDPERKLLACPWHNWEFDLENGQSWFDPVRTRVRPYQVEVASGRDLGGSNEGDAEGRVPGPYVAETMKVEVDGDYVVVVL